MQNVTGQELRQEETPPPATPRKRQAGIKLFSIKDVLELPSPTWLIEDVIELGSIGTIYAPPAEGKSFVSRRSDSSL
jgi:hypothetical protein